MVDPSTLTRGRDDECPACGQEYDIFLSGPPPERPAETYLPENAYMHTHDRDRYVHFENEEDKR